LEATSDRNQRSGKKTRKGEARRLSGVSGGSWKKPTNKDGAKKAFETYGM